MAKSFGAFVIFYLWLVLQAGVISCSNSEVKLKRSRLPRLRQKLRVENELGEPRTRFTGIFREDFTASVVLVDGNETAEELSRELSYETAWPRNGRRKATIVKVLNHENARKKERERFPLHDSKDVPSFLKRHKFLRRNRRDIFGRDNRFYIPARSFAQRYPFASVVKISTGCTGALVSPRHAITAAHCVHSGKDYVDGFRSLRVGLLQRDGTFNWIDVSHAKLPLAWVNGSDKTASKYDYVILKLSRKHKRPFLPVTISDGERHGRGDRIHFTAFEDDKPRNTLWYRFCRVEEDGAHMLYHFCDAKPGSSGAGVYVYHYDTHSRAWGRRLVAVFSGNRWVTYPSWWYMPPRNYNAATRITTLKFAQICKWIGPKHWPRECKDYVAPEPTTNASQTPTAETTTKPVVATATPLPSRTTRRTTELTATPPTLSSKTTTNSSIATAPKKTTRTSVLKIIAKSSAKLASKRHTEATQKVITPLVVKSPSTISTKPTSAGRTATRKDGKHRRKGHRRNKLRKQHKKTEQPKNAVAPRPTTKPCNETTPMPMPMPTATPTEKSQPETTIQATSQGGGSAVKPAAKARRKRKHRRNGQGHRRNKMRKHRKATQRTNTTINKKLGQITQPIKPHRVIEPTPTKPSMKGRILRR